jgi:hypothetical protein
MVCEIRVWGEGETCEALNISDPVIRHLDGPMHVEE